MVTAAPGRSWTILRNAVLTGSCISLVVECLQLLSDRRTASSLDVATNSARALLGYCGHGRSCRAALPTRACGIDVRRCYGQVEYRQPDVSLGVLV